MKTDAFVIVDVQGVGYKVFASETTLAKITENQEGIKLFCHLHVRENIMDLYGFLSAAEVELFELLKEISGVGPKAALQMASIGSFEDFRKAVAERNEAFFDGIHGIGKKKVQKIILELTGKIETIQEQKGHINSGDQEVIDALINLGFPRQKVRETLDQIPEGRETSEERIKEALKIIKR